MRNLIGIFSFLCFSLITLSLFVGVSKPEPKPYLKINKPHLFEDEKTSIQNIHITVFYFIPKDSENNKINNWKEITETHIKKLINFHELQFEKTSQIKYDFFSEAIIGEKSLKEYESLFNYEDHDALIPVKEEITRRVLSKNEELNKKSEHAEDSVSVRNVYLVVFEGKGAAGNGNFALISRNYLTEEEYTETGSTFLAHEFYHTLGLPDNYMSTVIDYGNNQQVKTSLITKKDIMGQVNVPITSTYIDTQTLKKMGL